MRGGHQAAAGMLAAGCAFAVFACGDDTSRSSGAGDHLIVDVDATDQPPQSSYDAAGDSPFAPVDGAYGALPDGFAPYDWCAQCACGAGTFCFGGGGASGAFSGTCGQGGSAGAPAIGCMPIPAACQNEPNCQCLLAAVSSTVPCYTVCSEENGFVVYCPAP